ncbi:GRAM protein [Geosmithia morbida]|uniref:GRAM protein n=1 Tax=Geosmithia morbida TaxID=1094350 RepID=A0A9P5D569_9HYPO|nr:GRAM protein [Geosmithia morbida]KAF4126872.1 GRAM protein [Geosmithia morbida]
MDTNQPSTGIIAFEASHFLATELRPVLASSPRDSPPPSLPKSPLRDPAQSGSGNVARPKTSHAVTSSAKHPDLGPSSKSKVDPLTLPPVIGVSSPAIVNTPPTPTLPSDDEDGFQPRPPATAATWKPQALGSPPADGTTSREAVNSHKRSASASATVVPSKLSHISVNPLTPATEGDEVPFSPSSGFFSSMLSAAQSAATNIGTGINIRANRGGLQRSATLSTESVARAGGDSKQQAEPEPSVSSPSLTETQDTMDNQKDSAIRTLGAGDLSLSQLGVVDPPSALASPASARFADLDNRGRSESAPTDNQDFASRGSSSRPHSLNGPPSRSATPSPDGNDKVALRQSGSLRSSRKAHRKRGSSVTTSNTANVVGAPLSGAATSPLPQNPAASVSTPKLTGFAIASKKRNRDFHNVFKSVPDDDYLIEDYSCALQREILAHGRLYVSEGHLCFSSNILGWSTTLVMSFDEIMSVEKRSTALLFKNGLMISTLHAKHIFASFTSRDATYDLIVNIWKLGHPTLTSTLNGVKVEGTGGDKTEKLDGDEPLALEGGEAQLDSGTEEETDDDDSDDFYVEDDSDLAAGRNSTADLNGDGAEAEKPLLRKASGAAANGAPAAVKDMPAAAGGASAAAAAAVDFPGPATHAPTDCGDSATHYDKVVGDDVIAAPLGQVYSLMFGANSAAFMTKFLSADSKCMDVQIEDKKGLSLDNRSHTYTYIKPLNSTIGPKSAKCIITETLDSLDYEKAANITMATQTPDVPSGNIFVVKTKYCLSWAENNSTRVFVNCTIEWSGKSWIKGPVEKAASDGQAEHCKLIFSSIRAALSSRSRANTGTNGAGGKGAGGKKKGKKGKAAQSSLQSAEKSGSNSNAVQPDWGPLEPVRSVAEPLFDIVRPLLTGNVMYGLLVGLLVAAWFGFGLSPKGGGGAGAGGTGGVGGAGGPGHYGYGPIRGGPDRMAAYDEMWRREDSNLWEWLEERTGMERMYADGAHPRRRVQRPYRDGRRDTKELEEALRVTQAKLKILEEAMGKSPSSMEG